MQTTFGEIASKSLYQNYFETESPSISEKHLFLVNRGDMIEIIEKINNLPERSMSTLLLIDYGGDAQNYTLAPSRIESGNRAANLNTISISFPSETLKPEHASQECLRNSLIALTATATMHSLFSGYQNLHVSDQNNPKIREYMEKYQLAINSLPGAEKFRIHSMCGKPNQADGSDEINSSNANGVNYVLLSGGPDSSTALMMKRRQQVINNSQQTKALFVNFGQPYRERELRSAVRIAQNTGVEIETLEIPDISDAFIGKGELGYPIFRELLPLTLVLAALKVRNNGGSELSHGQIYEDEIDIPGTNRFFQLLSKALEGLWNEGNGFGISIPFSDEDKSTVFEIALEINADIDSSVSCLKGGGDIHCGVCRACIRRKEAYTKAGMPDTTIYATGQGN